jgi:beta-lactamase class A
MRGAKIDALMDNLNLYKYKYDQIPSRSDLDRFLVKGIIDEGQYRSLMSRHGYSSLYTSWYVEELRGEITQGGRAPTKTDLDNWLKRKYITEDEYRIEMKALGFNDRYIELYLK